MRNLDVWKNKLIVFEGQDLTGKSSVAKALSEYLDKNGVDNIFTFQPGDVEWGPMASTMRSLCKDKRWNLHPLSNFFAFQLDRVEQTTKIVTPALENGKTVISDRWNYSTYAYQLYGKELIAKYNIPKEVLVWLNETAITCRKPDCVFYFPEKLNVNRKNDSNDNFDDAGSSFKDRVHNAYEELSKINNWTRVTPGSSIEATLSAVLDLMEKKYGN